MYPTEFVPDPDLLKEPAPPYRDALKSVATSAADLLHKELRLVREEFKESAKRIREHLMEAAVFGVMLFLSILPLLAFLILGMGELLNGRYWLSSLIVGVVFAVTSRVLWSRAWKKILKNDFDFTRTRTSLEHVGTAVDRKLHKMKNTVTGGLHGST